ncbi:YeiH family protein [Nocardia flavorosea]|uniref:Putative sulfate exporter family transporter n=1 Tax=Nocardia flavorosea TaxID=53429 RepID=A0A846YIC3_9NOCA|nr:putative sulfate exporter family transporter [Nocardia flavorosea]NKY57332.1 putative sulfate exporter family transporter [Nocardia flavorosea]
MTQTKSTTITAYMAALSVAAAALAVSTQMPLPGPLMLSLVAGIVVANTPLSGGETMRAAHAAGRTLLRAGVVVLGLRISGADILAVGAAGIAVVVLTVLCTYTATEWLGRRLGLDRDLVTLVAAGFSICGAAAIAAVNDTVRGRERNVAVAVALVTVFGTVMMVAVPGAASVLGLTTAQTAVWSGASIHEVAQVAAAASLAGGGVLALAMTIKLGRVVLLAPVFLAASRGRGRPSAARAVPWFVVGFVLAVALRSTGVLPAAAIGAAEGLTTVLLAAGMFGLGLAIRFKELWPVPPAALGLAAASTAVAAGVPLFLVVFLVG